jgi:hypothetical protein
MRDRHHARLCNSCRAPIARTEDACWRCGTPWAEDGHPTAPSATPMHLRPDHGRRQHQSSADAGHVGQRAHATAVRRRPVAATIAKPNLSRAAGAAALVLLNPAPGLVGEGSSEPSPLFTRHTRGTIEAQRDRRRQSRSHGGVAYRGTGRGRAASHVRITAAVAGDSRALAQARLDLDRWVDEGGLVPFEAAALLRATTS